METEILALILVLVAFSTSYLSSIMGMGGGIILMLVLLSLFDVKEAMLIHGVTQMLSNGYRSYLHRSSLQYSILGGYLLGALSCFVILKWISFAPDRQIALVFLGLFPFIGLVPKLGQIFSLTKPGMTFFSGILVTLAQITAGASGAVLDIFYLNAPFSRFQIIANKALTQTFGHLIKTCYFLTLMEDSFQHPALIIPLSLTSVSTFLGTAWGKRTLEKIEDHTFRKWAKVMVCLIALGSLSKAFI